VLLYHATRGASEGLVLPTRIVFLEVAIHAIEPGVATLEVDWRRDIHLNACAAVVAEEDSQDRREHVGLLYETK
jgi:hypothetical protein